MTQTNKHNKDFKGSEFLRSMELQLTMYMQGLDPNSDLYAWLSQTQTRLRKAQDMARE